ncbi:TPA: PTS sugar transporter subunit IIB [Streptococcus pneumoniae]|nr:PTS sugar transporter subunit IIB [Streptococcus pneumoniae]
MTMPNIIMTRIDERLIHGQGQLWVKYLGCNTVIVANDEVSTDKMQQTLMKTVVPDSVAMRFFPLQKVIDIIHKANPAQTIFIVVKNVKDALTLVEGGVPIKEINIGNIHNATGKEQVTFNTKTTPTGNDGAVQVNIMDYI